MYYYYYIYTYAYIACNILSSSTTLLGYYAYCYNSVLHVLLY